MNTFFTLVVVVIAVAMSAYKELKKGKITGDRTITPKSRIPQNRTAQSHQATIHESVTSTLQPMDKVMPSTPPISKSEEPSINDEYAFHSTEEAKKAIIWSEILQRKY